MPIRPHPFTAALPLSMVLAKDGGTDSQAQLAGYTRHPEVLEVLANHEREFIVRLVAINPFTPPDVLVKLASHSATDVRRSVHRHRNIPRNIARALADTAFKIPYNQIEL